MSDKLPRVTGKDVVRAFASLGFEIHRVKGSHHFMKKAGVENGVSVPVHSSRTLGIGLLKSLLRDAGVTPEEFREALKS